MDPALLEEGKKKLKQSSQAQENEDKRNQYKSVRVSLSRAWSMKICQVGLEIEVEEGLENFSIYSKEQVKRMALPEMCESIVQVLEIMKRITQKNEAELASMSYPPSVPLQELRCAVRILAETLKRCHEQPVLCRLLSVSVSGTVVASMIECEEALKKLASDALTSREFRTDLRESARKISVILNKTQVQELPPALHTAVHRSVLGLLLLALVQEGVATDEEDARQQIAQIVRQQEDEEKFTDLFYVNDQEAACIGRFSEECSRAAHISEEEEKEERSNNHAEKEAQVQNDQDVFFSWRDLHPQVKQPPQKKSPVVPHDGTPPPQEFICPLTQKIFIEPVLLLTDGRSFERSAIERWLAIHPKQDPITYKMYDFPLQIAPNRALLELVNRWRHARSRDLDLSYLRASLRLENHQAVTKNNDIITLPLQQQEQENKNPSTPPTSAKIKKKRNCSSYCCRLDAILPAQSNIQITE
uniref:U-box domain-containing protein n=1 Tax=Aureoumbra lagunensis TaxID=44058 RepID=A0A7S3NHK7_9STRA